MKDSFCSNHLLIKIKSSRFAKNFAFELIIPHITSHRSFINPQKIKYTDYLTVKKTLYLINIVI